jgi:hypothetical protein
MEIMHQQLHKRSGSLKEFVALAKTKNPETLFTNSFLYREVIISKLVVPKVKKYWMRRSKMANFIKSRTLQSNVVSRVVFCRGGCSPTIPTAHGSEVAISRAGAFKVL